VTTHGPASVARFGDVEDVGTAEAGDLHGSR